METRTRITDYELLSHGFDHSQYFQGCGTSFTSFEHVVTGCGGSEKEAFENALEQITDADDSVLNGILERLSEDRHPSESEDMNEIYFYYSIRYNTQG
jgi:hypothetical protein